MNMDTTIAAGAAKTAPVYVIHAPAEQTIPFVYCSPHSGTDYNEAFRRASRLDFTTLRKSEDSHVDALFGAAPTRGAPLLCALFPRAYVDPNREPYELDQTMFEDRLPDFVNTASPRVAAGLGTIAKVVCNGAEIYRRKLRFSEALTRIDTYYRPYHAALQQLLDETRRRFGVAVLVDCHSMPSIGGPMDKDPGARRVDFVLGDAFGAACHPALTLAAESKLRSHGYAVHRNMPYAGGYTTRHYGSPARGQHALQIEINRALYMDEDTYARRPQFAVVEAHLGELIAHLSTLDLKELSR